MGDVDQPHVNRLAQVAIQLAARVRDEGPEDNGAWLATVLPDPADWFRLSFVLAAAVPDDQTWGRLTAWARGVHDLDGLDDADDLPTPVGCGPTIGTPAGARRHWRRGEQPCDACMNAERERNRLRREARKNTELEIAA